MDPDKLDPHNLVLLKFKPENSMLAWFKIEIALAADSDIFDFSYLIFVKKILLNNYYTSL